MGRRHELTKARDGGSMCLPVLVGIQPLGLRKHRDWRIPSAGIGNCQWVLSLGNLWGSAGHVGQSCCMSMDFTRSRLEGDPKSAGAVLQDLLGPLQNSTQMTAEEIKKTQHKINDLHMQYAPGRKLHDNDLLACSPVCQVATVTCK